MIWPQRSGSGLFGISHIFGRFNTLLIFLRLHNDIVSYCFQDPDDLPFEKGEILSLIRKDEEQWWTACNSRGQKGLVPVPYIERVTCTTFLIVRAIGPVMQDNNSQALIIYKGFLAKNQLMAYCSVANNYHIHTSRTAEARVVKFCAYVKYVKC